MATGIGNLPYTMPPVSPFDVITSQAENERIANIESLADGTGIGDGSITAEKIDSSTFPKFRAIRTSAATIGPGSGTVVVPNSIAYNIGSNYNSTTGRFTAPVDGYYHFDGVIGALNVSLLVATLFVNGVEESRGDRLAMSSPGNAGASVSDTLYLTAGQYVQLAGIANINASVINVDKATRFSGFLVGY